MEKIKKKTRKHLSKNIFIITILAYPLTLFFVFYVGINVNSFIMAFQKFYLDGTVTFAAFDNFKIFITDLFSTGELLTISMKNSLIMYVLCTGICFPLNILFSYVLFKKVFGHSVLRAVVMLPSIVSGFIFCMVFKYFASSPFQRIMIDLGIVNFPNLLMDVDYIFGTTIFFSIWTSFAGALIIYPNAMNSIAPEIIESSKIDGVSNIFQDLRYIILPLIYPTLTTFIVTGFAGLLISSGPLVAFFMYSASPSVYNMGYYFLVKVVGTSSTLDYPILAAGGMLMTIVMAPLTLALKWIMEKLSPVSDA